MAQQCKELISKFRRVNAENENFVLIRPFLENFTGEVVEAILDDCDLQPYLRRELQSPVARGGKLVLAILVDIDQPHLITNFYKHQNPNVQDLDSRLPYSSMDELRNIIPADYMAFYTKQWEFTSPIFQANLQDRTFPDRTVLPYLNIERIGEGGFGKVYKVRLPGMHQDIQKTDEEVELVLKEMKPGSDRSFEEERHILSLLRGLRNPNIVQYFTSYILQRKIYLLFEVAEGDLEEFISRPKEDNFTTEVALRAIHGFCVALCDLHNYLSEPDDLRMIGCHYDLRLDNILVKDGRFLLADFGLSRMKPEEFGSKSLFKRGLHDYLAPECQSLKLDDMSKYPIGRASDIWSLGCILMEILIWLTLGHKHLDDFVNNRSVQIAHFRIGMFHDGQGNLNPKVSEWLQLVESWRLETKDLEFGRTVGLLIHLVCDILKINPEDRLNARQIANTTFHIMHSYIAQSINGAMQSLCRLSKGSLEMELERERFYIWSEAVGLVDGTSFHGWYQLQDSLSQLQRIDGLLKALKNELEELNSILQNPESEIGRSDRRRSIYYYLADIIKSLWDVQGTEMKRDMNFRLEDILLNRYNVDLSFDQALFQEHGSQRMRLLLAMKETTLSVSTYRLERRFFLDRVHLSKTYVARTGTEKLPFSLGEMTVQDTTSKVPVLIESMKYNDHWIGKQDLLMDRIEGLVSTLNALGMSNMFPVLRCRNFCHDPPTSSFELIYELPLERVGSDKRLLKPLNLCELIKESHSRSKRPSLGCMFKLAHCLASNILNFHRVGWLHKNISSYQLIFFRPASGSYEEMIDSPYIIGFNHSRENNESAFTVGPQFTVAEQDYQHPEYLKNSHKTNFRYRQQFDYYSLGLVLLEIGRWKPLVAMMRGREKLSPEKVLEAILKDELPEVMTYMGKVYSQIIKCCLTGDFTTEGAAGPNIDSEVRMAFSKRVVRPLQLCLAIHE